MLFDIQVKGDNSIERSLSDQELVVGLTSQSSIEQVLAPYNPFSSL